MPSLSQHLRAAASALERAGREAPRRTAEALLEHTLGQPRAYLFAHAGDELPPDRARAFDHAVARRAAGEPLQYITGVEEFFGREFRVAPGVLIPRPETELVAAAALERLPSDRPVRVLDVGTGSGCLAATLALERPRATVVASDLSASALEIAKGNAVRLGARVHFVRADLLAPLEGPFDLIVSNPPYLAEDELPALAAEVRDHEPRSALVAGPEGTEVYARLLPAARAALAPGGWLVLELGFASAPRVRSLAAEGWAEVQLLRDSQGWDRVFLTRRSPG